MADENEVFVVVWIGKEFDTPSMPMHNVKVCSTLEGAREHVAWWLEDVGGSGWDEVEPGMVWHKKATDCYISIVGDTID